jgi:hypothetical protein
VADLRKLKYKHMKNSGLFSIFILLLLSSILFTACPIEDSADVNQDKIYTDYEVFYNSNTDKTQVLAKFRFGGATGTILELKDPAEVYFKGDKLPFKPLYGGHFKEYAGRITEGTFRYTNTDSVVYFNEIPDAETIDFPDELDRDTLTKSTAYTFTWIGTPLKENQSVGVFVGSWTWGQDALFYENAVGATNIIMGTHQLGNLPAGSSTWFLDRATQVQVTEGTAEGGYVRAKYRAKNIEVIMVE